jgi:hypothetical protein
MAGIFLEAKLRCMIDFLQFASTTATRVLFPDQGFLYNDNFCTAGGVRAYKMVLFVESHTVRFGLQSSLVLTMLRSQTGWTVGGPNLLMPSSW